MNALEQKHSMLVDQLDSLNRKLDKFINGDENDTIATSKGVIKTIAGVVKDIKDIASGIDNPTHNDIVMVAAEPIQHFMVVTSNLEGNAIKATNSVPDHFYHIDGVARTSVSAGNTLQIARYGNLTNPDWNFIQNKPVFLGIDGAIVQTVINDENSKFVVQIGIALSPTTIKIDVKPLINFS